MAIPALTIIDILQQLKDNAASYTNIPLTLVNDHVIRVSVMTESFYWHFHPNSAETFMVIEGSIFIDLDNETIELFPGQLFTIPEKVNHRTRPNGHRSVNLTIERGDMETVKIGE